MQRLKKQTTLLPMKIFYKNKKYIEHVYKVGVEKNRKMLLG